MIQKLVIVDVIVTDPFKIKLQSVLRVWISIKTFQASMRRKSSKKYKNERKEWKNNSTDQHVGNTLILNILLLHSDLKDETEL